MGMQRLLDVLQPGRDPGGERPLRNGALQLWDQLTRTNGDMKTFLALQEGFDHLAAIIRGNGGGNMANGDVVLGVDSEQWPITKDCLVVMRNVVRYSPMTQSLLCQSESALRLFPALLEIGAAAYEKAVAAAAHAAKAASRSRTKSYNSSSEEEDDDSTIIATTTATAMTKTTTT